MKSHPWKQEQLTSYLFIYHNGPHKNESWNKQTHQVKIVDYNAPLQCATVFFIHINIYLTTFAFILSFMKKQQTFR